MSSKLLDKCVVCGDKACELIEKSNDEFDIQFETNIIDRYLSYSPIGDHNSLKEQILQYYQKFDNNCYECVPIAKPFTDYSYQFTEAESKKLTELLNASLFMKNHFTGGTIIEAKTIGDFYVHWVPKVESDLKNLVSMSKCLTGFENLCDNDRICLMKYGSSEISHLRMIEFFNFVDNYWTILNNNNYSIVVKLDTLNSFRQFPIDWKNDYFLKSVSDWDPDPIILDLLTAIMLFNPNRSNLMYSHVIKLQQRVYLYLLQRYLLMKYRCKDLSKSRFINLMQMLSKLTLMCKLLRVCLRKDKPKLPDKRSLYQEIYDLK
ncbi:nuclear hormone receptor HR96-like [Oppia nitens]|uniref:nuclear hormone receptor HR96-like n=1 Tax=Oppia nitens TaxID=1686743 RepID=UPI0023DC8D3E|nr:nuclear hormone receptor HR96-like [Oppia nitens]